MRVQIDPEQPAQMGITEGITVTLPPGFATFTPAERREWARQEIEATAVEILRDVAAAHGKTPNPAQEAAYLLQVRPGIDAALAGVAR